MRRPSGVTIRFAGLRSEWISVPPSIAGCANPSHLNVDDRFGGQTGYSGRADVIDIYRDLAESVAEHGREIRKDPAQPGP